MNTDLEQRLAVLEARNADNERLIESLLKSGGNPLATREQALAAMDAADARSAAVQARGAHRRAVLAMSEPERSAAVLEMSAPELSLAYKSLPAPEAHAFARALTEAAYEWLIEALGNGAAQLAFALADCEPMVTVRPKRNTDVRTATFELRWPETATMPRWEWEEKLAADEALRAFTLGHQGDRLAWKTEPSLVVEDLSVDEARRHALNAWRDDGSQGRPLPPRAKR